MPNTKSVSLVLLYAMAEGNCCLGYNTSPKVPLRSADEVSNLHTYKVTLTLSFVVVVPDSRGGESDPELVEVLRGRQELREQGHVEDPPARASAEHQQRLEGGERERELGLCL